MREFCSSFFALIFSFCSLIFPLSLFSLRMQNVWLIYIYFSFFSRLSPCILTIIIYAYGVMAMCIMYYIGWQLWYFRWMWNCLRDDVWFFPMFNACKHFKVYACTLICTEEQAKKMKKNEKNRAHTNTYLMRCECVHIRCICRMLYDANSYYEWFNLYA